MTTPAKSALDAARERLEEACKYGEGIEASIGWKVFEASQPHRPISTGVHASDLRLVLDEIEALRKEIERLSDSDQKVRSAVGLLCKTPEEDYGCGCLMFTTLEGVLRLRGERDFAQAEVERLRAALTPSGKTKAAYMGEFKFTIDGEYERLNVQVPWTTIKDIMAAISKRAALRAPAAPAQEQGESEGKP